MRSSEEGATFNWETHFTEQ